MSYRNVGGCIPSPATCFFAPKTVEWRLDLILWVSPFSCQYFKRKKNLTLGLYPVSSSSFLTNFFFKNSQVNDLFSMVHTKSKENLFYWISNDITQVTSHELLARLFSVTCLIEVMPLGAWPTCLNPCLRPSGQAFQFCGTSTPLFSFPPHVVLGDFETQADQMGRPFPSLLPAVLPPSLSRPVFPHLVITVNLKSLTNS